jgi:hypothetical protein
MHLYLDALTHKRDVMKKDKHLELLKEHVILVESTESVLREETAVPMDRAKIVSKLKFLSTQQDNAWKEVSRARINRWDMTSAHKHLKNIQDDIITWKKKLKKISPSIGRRILKGLKSIKI